MPEHNPDHTDADGAAMTTAEPELQRVRPDRLHPHPDNPRLVLREDVVERIAAEITRTGFGAQHAITARPRDGAFQIVAGHHRVEAARRAGVDVPVWVTELDDVEAFMQLVLSNSQGELTPLEIGVHALRAVPPAKGGRGQTGGLSEYAERLGRSKQYISQLRSAGDVAINGNCPVDLTVSAQHFFEISRAPQTVWPALVEALGKRGWTVADTQREVATVNRIADTIPGAHAAWLPLEQLTARYLASGKPGPAAVEQLAASAASVLAAIAAREDDEPDADHFQQWLVDHTGAEAWNRREISNYHVALIRTWAERDAAAAEAAAEEEIAPALPDGVDIRHGDLLEALADLPDRSVDVIITDPPYPEEHLPLFGKLAELAARVLKPGGVCAAMSGQSFLPQIHDAMRKHLTYHWEISYATPGGQATQLWQRKVNNAWKPILLYTRGAYRGDWIGDVARSDVNDNDKNHHHWGQSTSGMTDLVQRLSKPGWLVCDPFLGGGTTAVVCHEQGRRFVGCDVDETCVETTVARFTAAAEKQEGAA